MKRKLAKLYRVLLVLALIPALLILSLRLGLPQLSRFSDEISAYLSSTLGVQLRIGTLHASLEQLQIRLHLEDLTLLSQDASAPMVSVKAERLDLTLDLLRSLQYRVPVFRMAELQQADVLWQQQQGRWLPDMGEPSGDGPPSLLALLSYQPSLVLRNVHVGLQPEDGELQLISPINAMLEAAAGEYQISGSARMPRIGEDAYAVFALHALSLDFDDLLAGHYRFFLQSDALGPEVLNLGVLPLEMDALNLSAHVWGEWEASRLTELQGDFSITPLTLSGDRWPEIDHLRSRFVLLPVADGQYQLQLRGIQAATQGVLLSLPELITEFHLAAGQQWVMPEFVRLSELDLAGVHHWVDQLDILPEAAESVLARLAPVGQVSDLLIAWQQPEDWLSFILEARLDEVAVSAWEDAPEASGISGQLQATLTEGTILLESAAFTLNFPELFGSGWQYSEASGQVSWQVTGDALRLNSGLLSLSNDAIHAKGRFGLYRPFDPEEQIEFSLLIGITDTDALQTEFYTPPRELGETLYDWLKSAIRAGQVNQAGLMIHAGLRPQAHHLPVSVQLFLDAEQAEFAFHPDWPVVQDGQIFLHLRDTELRIDIASGSILNSDINSGWVYLPRDSQQLHVAAVLQGDASDFSLLLQESALGGYLGSGFDDWQLRGDTQTRLGLRVPVDNPDAIDVQVSSRLQGSQLHLQDRDLRFTDISGQVLYTTQAGLRSTGLRGRLYGEAIEADISTQGERTRVALQGMIATEHLDHLTGLSLGDRFDGKSQVDMALTLCAEQGSCPRLELSSNLLGTAIDLPAGLGKTADQPRLLNIDLYPEQQRLHFSYDSLLQGVLDLSQPLRGQLLFGTGVALLPQASHLELRGSVPQFAVEGNLSRQADGRWQAHLDHLHWRSSEAEASAAPTPPVTESPVDVSSYPQLSLKIDDLRVGERALGQWSLDMKPQRQHVSYESIRGQFQGFTVTGHAHWQAGPHPSTDLTLNLNGADLAEVLEHWGQGRPIETQALSATAQLTWRGAPWQFGVSSLDGVFSFQADQGRIIESGSGANLLRVFGLLNLNTLSRRLRLDFSDLLKRGLVFDQLKADYELSKGIATTRDALIMTGPSASMEITGQVDLNTHQLDKTIQVSVPLGSNLTLGAVLLGAPQVAGALFIFDRIMGDRIEKMTRIAYTLKGDWDDPQLNLLNPAGGR